MNAIFSRFIHSFFLLLPSSISVNLLIPSSWFPPFLDSSYRHRITYSHPKLRSLSIFLLILALFLSWTPPIPIPSGSSSSLPWIKGQQREKEEIWEATWSPDRSGSRFLLLLLLKLFSFLNYFFQFFSPFAREIPDHHLQAEGTNCSF